MRGGELLKDIIEKLDLINIFRTSHTKTSEYIFFLSACGTFSRIDHILGLITKLTSTNLRV